MNLEDYLKTSGKSASAFAGEIGVEFESVRRYLAGERIPKPDVMARIKDVTGEAVTANDFHLVWERRHRERPSPAAAE